MSYFNSPIAYIFIGIFLVVGNWLFFSPFFLAGQASLRSYFMLLPWVLLFLAPAITMRLWSEEKQSGTIEFLLTLPAGFNDFKILEDEVAEVKWFTEDELKKELKEHPDNFLKGIHERMRE